MPAPAAMGPWDKGAGANHPSEYTIARCLHTDDPWAQQKALSGCQSLQMCAVLDEWACMPQHDYGSTRQQDAVPWSHV
jgi:hypothetical protein